MARRILDFADGFTSASAPTTGSMWSVSYAPGAPYALGTSDTIIPSGFAMEIFFVSSDGGAVTSTASPQINPGTDTGQMVRLVGDSDTDTITFVDGLGLVLNGNATLAANSTLDLMWNGTNWIEVARNDI